MQKDLPIIAIVGRPNVGKSTLFNRLVGSRRAITSPIAGTTRDRVSADVTWNGRTFKLVDTGGLDIPDPENVLDQQIVDHAMQAVATANLILFVIDSRAELLALDMRAAEILRRSKKKVILIANKAENIQDESQLAEVYKLGLGSPMLISARHGTGSGDLLDEIDQALDAPSSKDTPERINITLVGRPNVGKSSLLNSISGTKLAIVSDIPGTTRDTIDTDFEFKGEQITLIDTAGLRRTGKVKDDLEFYSVTRAKKAIERTDVMVLVLDSSQSIAKQDQAITALTIEAGVGLVIAANKWDLKEDEDDFAQRMLRSLSREFTYLPWAPVVFVSAKTGLNIEELLSQSIDCYYQRSKMIDHDELWKYVHRFTMATPPPQKGRTMVKIRDCVQTGVNPPIFNLTLVGGNELHFSYKRFIERKLRERYDFTGTPIRIKFSEKKE
jgi:GTP-binding protein